MKGIFMNEKSKYQNCPMCGSICEIESNLNEGAYRFVPVGDNAELQAENAELWAFVQKVHTSPVIFEKTNRALRDEAHALLQKRKAAR